MNYPDLILVRYEAGTGGENLCLFLDELLNRQSKFGLDAFNRVEFQDLFDSAFQRTRTADGKHRWRDVAPEDVAQYVAERYASSTIPYKVAKSHFILTPETFDAAFPGATVIDIVPNPVGNWMNQALLYHKLGSRPAFLTSHEEQHPQYQEAVEFHAKHGYVPNHWNWSLSRGCNIHDLAEIMAQDLIALQGYTAQKHAARRDVALDSVGLMTNLELSSFKMLADRFDVPPPEPLLAKMHKWVSGNLAIFDDMNIRQYIGKPVPLEDQICMLTGYFKTKQAELLKRPK